MRLPWPFGRRTPPDGPSSAATEAGGVSMRPADPVPPALAAGPAPTGAWSRLPPIQRTVGAVPLVAPSAPFLDDVPGHRALPPILKPLGHEISPVAPAGLVVAHARPVPALTSHAELPTRHVQRHAAGRPEVLPAAAGPALVDDVPPAATGSAPRLEPEPVRRLPAFPAAAVTTPPARPLTRAATPSPAGGPVVSRSASTAAPSAGADGPAPGRHLAARVAHGSPATTPDPATPARPASRWAEARTEPSVTAAPEPALDLGPRRGARELPRPETLAAGAPDAATGRPRRPGLGAPIPVQPASAVDQRLPVRVPARRPGEAASAAGASGPVPSGGPRQGHDPMTGPPGTAPVIARAASAIGDQAPGMARLPVLPVVRRGDRTVSASDARADAAPTAGTAALAAPPAARPSVQRAERQDAVRPTLGHRPIRPGIRLSPAAEPTPRPPTMTRPAAEAPVAARWDGPAELPPVVGPAPLTSGSSAAVPFAVPLQRAPLEPGTASSPGAVGTDLPQGAQEMVFPSRDAAPAPGLPAAQVVASSAAPHGGPASRTRSAVAATRDAARPLTLARAVAPAPSTAPLPAPVAEAAPIVGRIVAGPAGPAEPPTVQTSRSGGPAGTPIASITATPVVQRVEGSAPVPESGPAQRSDSELDDLARALFGRIRSHLRAEVIHEREAKGLTFDAF